MSVDKKQYVWIDDTAADGIHKILEACAPFYRRDLDLSEEEAHQLANGAFRLRESGGFAYNRVMLR